MTLTMEEYSTHRIHIIHILGVLVPFVSSKYMFQILNPEFQYISKSLTLEREEGEIVQTRSI